LDFQEFPKMARWSRDVIVTEKIDGTNAAVVIEDGMLGEVPVNAIAKVRNLNVYAQSRTRFITPADDNFGFAAWVVKHAEELAAGLGEGRHFGEWWGAGIQRRYGLTEKRFSLFNVGRWYAPADCAGEETTARQPAPSCCGVVPILAQGPNLPGIAETTLDLLRERGSFAAPGFMDPEGIVIWHTAANVGFKKTVHKDEMPKTMAQQASRAFA
jgi:hypothetical protein